MHPRSRRLHPPRLPKYVFKIRDLYYFRYLLAKNIALRLNKKELPLALKTRYISEVAKIVSELSQWFVYRYRQSYNKLLSYFLILNVFFYPKNFLVVVYTQLYLRLFPKLFTCPN